MMPPNKSKKAAMAIRDSSPEAGPSVLKQPRTKASSEDGDDTPSRIAGSNAYGPSSVRSPSFSGQKKPAELFRKDLISAMKLADKDSLPDESYFLISDPWRQEWEKGVQVPVNVTDIKQVVVREIHEKSKTGDFKMPHKLLHERADDIYKKGQHELTGMSELAEQLVRYDLDDLDVCWLEEVNFRLREMGLVQINEWNMERVIEALETRCHERMMDIKKTEEGFGIEYDEDVVCDICRSPESEENNEMVFCDKCDIGVHQACYGISSIPDGSWLCRTCAVGVKAKCMLCPNTGGAMKSTRSGTKWAHVSCALWIPEVSFGDPERIEPITKISHIPPSRWSLICCICKERVGACIQCCVKTCKTAFHVTCGFADGLQMKTVLDEKEVKDAVKFKAYCPKHSKKRELCHSESDLDSPRKRQQSGLDTPQKKSPCKASPRKGSPQKDSPSIPKKGLTQQERANQRAKKLKSLEEDFYQVLELTEICKSLQLTEETVNFIYIYWKLKRKCNWDKPLLTPKKEEADILEKQEEDSRVARMKMFVHLRHDLERVRNLCYMISKREKMKRQFFNNKEHVFKSMVRVLKNKSFRLSKTNVKDIVHNYHFDSVYDDYGRSVQKLPGELTQDEEDAAEVVEKVPVKPARRPGRPRLKKNTTGSESQKPVSGDVVFNTINSENKVEPPKRRGRKRKNATVGEVTPKNKCVPVHSVEGPASLFDAKADSNVESEEGSILIFSAGESEDEPEKLKTALRTLAESQSQKKKDCEKSWLSPFDGRKTIRRGKQKKRRRGRKPWYEKKDYYLDLNPSLAVSTDDDDTKSSYQETKNNRDLVDETVMVDVEGEDGASDQTLKALHELRGESYVLQGHENAWAEPSNTRTKSDQSETMEVVRTESDCDQAESERAALKLSDVRAVTVHSRSGNGVKRKKRGARKNHLVSSSLPLRTSKRKGRPPKQKPNSKVSRSTKLDITLEESEMEAELSSKKIVESSDDASMSSVSKVKRSGRHRTKRKMLNSEKGKPVSRKLELEKRDESSDYALYADSVVLSGQRKARSRVTKVDVEAEKAESESVRAGECSEGMLCDDSNSSEVSEKSNQKLLYDAGEDVETNASKPSKRGGRKSSHRARLLWNKLLKSPKVVLGSKEEPSKFSITSASQLTDNKDQVTEQSTMIAVSSKERESKVKVKEEENSTTASFTEHQQLSEEKFLKSSAGNLTAEIKKMISSDLRNTSERDTKTSVFKCRRRRGKRGLIANGVKDNKQKKIDSFFATVGSQGLNPKTVGEGVDDNLSQNMTLKEIKVEVTENSQKNVPVTQVSAHENSGSYSRDSCVSSESEVVSVSSHSQQETEQKTGSPRKTEASPGGNNELEAVTALSKGQCEADQFNEDNFHGFRSQSPSSDASTITALCMDSRESTPRPFTRSQVVEDSVENSPSERAGRGKMKNRDHISKNAKCRESRQ